MTASETQLMKRALKLALKGRGHVSPNPRVGAVIVGRDGQILGEGYHRCFGGAHAEIEALRDCKGADTRGAAIVVTLEPCCHHGKTPPCAEAVINAGIAKVVTATIDPNPRVNGGGIDMLRSAGVEVVSGVLEEQAKYLNRGYLSMRHRGRAWCSVKVALSLDGKMADHQRRSKWITGAEARRLAHRLRADHDAILIGGGTVEHDDPELTVRLVKGPNPRRLILSPTRGLPRGGTIARTALKVPTTLITAGDATPDGADIAGVELWKLPASDGKIDFRTLLRHLPDKGVCSVLVEGGAGVLSGLMSAGVVDEIAVGIAPVVIGKGISPFEEFIPGDWESKPKFELGQVSRYGQDVVIYFHREKRLFSRD